MTERTLVKVAMADMNVSREGVLKTVGLGSCVGVTLYDAENKIGGMAHIMLPDSSLSRDGAINLAKYADTAIPELIRRMRKLGASPHLEAKLAGGAQMFAFSTSEALRIGPRNIESCKEQLKLHSIPLIAEDTGGNYGRTIELCCRTGILYVRSVHQKVKEI